MVDEIQKGNPDVSSSAPVTPEPSGARPTDASAPPPIPPPVSEADASNPLKTDIAKILQDVKLPERKDFKASGDRKIIAEMPAEATSLAAIDAVPQKEEVRADPKSAVVPVHTLKQDLQGVVRDTKMSVVRAVALEQGKKRLDPIDVRSAQSKRGLGMLFASGLLVLLGLASLFGVYFVIQKSAGGSEPQRSDSLVFSEQTRIVPLSDMQPNALKSQIAQARIGGNAPLGSITRIVPVVSSLEMPSGARPATLSEFFRAIGARPPSDLVRALDTTFFFGLHTVDKNAPALVIPVTSYDHAFAGMLAWEKDLNPDLAPIFTAVPTLETDSSGLPHIRLFKDDVMRNYDVRALRDDAGLIQLYYVFPTRTFLIIAESPYTFTEILSRLQAERRL